MRKIKKGEPTNTKEIFLSKSLIIVKLSIFLPNVLIQRAQIVMMKYFLINNRDMRKETRNKIK